MLRICFLVLGVLMGASPAADPIPLARVVEQSRANLEASGNGRDTISLKIIALAKESPLRISIPAGTRFVGDNGEMQVTLRDFESELAANSSIDVILPSAALSSRNSNVQRALQLLPGSEPKLARLLSLFGQQNDLPRVTAQLAILILLEDLEWSAWKRWLQPAWAAEKPPKPHPTAAEVAQAVDAVGLARLAAPDAKLAILQEEEFKRIALRNPWARGKAMALYGLTVEDAITGDSSLPPDLGKLLHTSPNDNCPICRQRQKEPAEIP